MTDALDPIMSFHPYVAMSCRQHDIYFHNLRIDFSLYFPLRSTENGKEDIAPSTSNNSTQTPSDLSPLLIPGGEEVLPRAHHQNPGHCISSFASINKMRKNAQVRVTPINNLVSC